jgi:hypothetical protein
MRRAADFYSSHSGSTLEDHRSRTEVAMGTDKPVVPKRHLEEEVQDLAMLFESQPPRPDWEQLIETGTVPALILGAERRRRRN